MSEEEIDKMKQKVNCNENSDCNECPYKMGDECLLYLYNKEKEKNKELYDKNMKMALNGGSFEAKHYIENNYIHKDKIKAKIEELKNDEKNIREKKKNSYDYDRSSSRLKAYLTKTKEMIKRLEELLEEN